MYTIIVDVTVCTDKYQITYHPALEMSLSPTKYTMATSCFIVLVMLVVIDFEKN